jgi:alkylation response protein AidB-like acyl-CoA dehydrogenase
VFFEGASAEIADRVGEEGEGWKVAMGLLAFERGASTLAQQMHFRTELDQIIAAAKQNGKAADPVIRQKLAQAHIGLKIMRYNALRMLSATEGGAPSPEGYTYKLYWSQWHRDLGELAMDVLGQAGETGRTDGCFAPLQSMFLMSRADAGTNQIQRNIIAERALGLPREPRG